MSPLYGSQTKKALENFPISGLALPAQFIRVLAGVKAAAASANKELGELHPAIADAIVAACEEIECGKHDAQFPVDVFQTGSGTSTNMNMNEVAATIATSKCGQAVHPNDHVNRGQSSNDVIPTAIHLAAVVGVKDQLMPNLEKFQSALETKATEFAHVVKLGRTHLQDAVPITLGQEFGGYARQVELGTVRLQEALGRATELPIGGTAVGTGLHAHPEFAARVCELLSKRFDFEFREAVNHFEANANRSACLELSGVLRIFAIDLRKIADDIRWMSSGFVIRDSGLGLGEITLPELQLGSSIMPGKVNPVLCESVLQVCSQVIGNDATISHAACLSNFELNVGMPVIAYNLLQSIEILSNVTKVFNEKCVRGIRANADRLKEQVERSPMLATALAPYIGYEKAAAISRKALKEAKTVREVALEEGIDEALLDRVLDCKTLVGFSESS